MGNEKDVGAKITIEKIVYHDKTDAEIQAIADANNERYRQEAQRLIDEAKGEEK